MAMSEEFSDWCARLRARFERFARESMSSGAEVPEELHEAVRYALLNGGKRFRPLLVYAVAEMTGAELKSADFAALALECIHSYSLVHDDLPCMDNDDFRRGKPTCHKAFGEAMALIAADALQARAFEFAVQAGPNPRNTLKIVKLLARGAGEAGMCGGQALDMLLTGKEAALEDLRRMHSMKTGALIRTAALCGLYLGREEPSRKSIADLDAYASSLGMLFQITDDILDATQDSSVLGKTAGKDAQEGKSTFVTVLGLEGAREAARACREDAGSALSGLQGEFGIGPGTARLADLADFVAHRSY